MRESVGTVYVGWQEQLLGVNKLRTIIYLMIIKELHR